MARVLLTPNLARHLDTASLDVEGATVREVLARVFAQRPALRSYVLDDQGALRQHVTVFVDGRAINDRSRLSDSVPADAEIYVLQALSGG